MKLAVDPVFEYYADSFITTCNHVLIDRPVIRTTVNHKSNQCLSITITFSTTITTIGPIIESVYCPRY